MAASMPRPVRSGPAHDRSRGSDSPDVSDYIGEANGRDEEKPPAPSIALKFAFRGPGLSEPEVGWTSMPLTLSGVNVTRSR
ncbi:MAG TPA: hypothetical protein DCQ98_05865 [Planctomycetaceae bacterium]|nr:hypothetical protein [Planctomycetaceae bacterium]